jgi:hypothetical protein
MPNKNQNVTFTTTIKSTEKRSFVTSSKAALRVSTLPNDVTIDHFFSRLPRMLNIHLTKPLVESDRIIGHIAIPLNTWLLLYKSSLNIAF